MIVKFDLYTLREDHKLGMFEDQGPMIYFDLKERK
jgi:hypothetical protein